MAFYGLPLTERQELFCRHVARGASAAAAARAAGYAPGNAAHQGAALLAKPPVRRRVEALRLRREGTRRIAITEMVDMLRTILKIALEKGELRTALRCVEVEARLCGLFPDRLSHEFAACDPLLDGFDPRGPGDAPMDLQDPPFEGAPEPDPQPAAGAEPEISAGVDGTPMTPQQSPACSPSRAGHPHGPPGTPTGCGGGFRGRPAGDGARAAPRHHRRADRGHVAGAGGGAAAAPRAAARR